MIKSRVAIIAFLSIALATGCGAGQVEERAEADGVDPQFVRAVEAFGIEPEDVEAAPDAPAWCQMFLSESVRTLPSASLAIGDAQLGQDVRNVFEAAASSLLEAAGGAPQDVAVEAQRLAKELETFPVEEPTSDAITRLQVSFDALSATTGRCGFQ